VDILILDLQATSSPAIPLEAATIATHPLAQATTLQAPHTTVILHLQAAAITATRPLVPAHIPAIHLLPTAVAVILSALLSNPLCSAVPQAAQATTITEENKRNERLRNRLISAGKII